MLPMTSMIILFCLKCIATINIHSKTKKSEDIKRSEHFLAHFLVKLKEVSVAHFQCHFDVLFLMNFFYISMSKTFDVKCFI